MKENDDDLDIERISLELVYLFNS